MDLFSRKPPLCPGESGDHLPWEPLAPLAGVVDAVDPGQQAPGSRAPEGRALTWSATGGDGPLSNQSDQTPVLVTLPPLRNPPPDPAPPGPAPVITALGVRCRAVVGTIHV